MNQRVISFHYKLTDDTGALLDASEADEPLAFLEGGENIIPGLEAVLITLKKGDKKKVSVPSADAYGERNEELIVQVPRDELPTKKIEVGDIFSGGDEEQTLPFTVIEVTDTEVTLDGNHPLAGQDLTFDVEIVDIREATAEELMHGHAHGLGGHHSH